MRTTNLFLGFVFGGLVAACVASSTDDETLYMTGTEEFAITGPNGEKLCENPKKQLVCHIPPGNPANAHTICVSKHAVATHTSHHGDPIGACATEGGGDTPPGGDDGDDGDDGGGDDGGGDTPDGDTPPPDGDTPPGANPPGGVTPPLGEASCPTCVIGPSDPGPVL